MLNPFKCCELSTLLFKEQLSAEDFKVLRHLYWTLKNEDEKKFKCN